MDRRSLRRVDCEEATKYRSAQTDTFKLCLVKNISANGALLWISEEIALGGKVEFLMESEHDANPAHIHMRVVRTEETPYRNLTGYGCKLEMMVSETT